MRDLHRNFIKEITMIFEFVMRHFKWYLWVYYFKEKEKVLEG